MRIAIFGMGYVGAVSSVCLAELGHEVIGVDLNPAKVKAVNDGIAPLVEDGVPERLQAGMKAGRIRATEDAAEAVRGADVSFISVGTPSGRDGTPNLAAVEAVSRQIGAALKGSDRRHTVVVRSTVSPGTTEELVAPAVVEAAGRAIGDGLDVAFNPEFLREGAAVKDFFSPPMTVLGSIGEQGYDVLEEVYGAIDAPVYRTSCRIAESIKYVSNAYHAVKITFANEFGAMLKQLGMDGREAMALFCRDTQLNISPAYLRPGFAFGGSCLPKEVRAVRAFARRFDLSLPMLESVLASNEAQIERAFQMATRNGRERIALFGLSFKPKTDDLRESPYVLLAERLLGKGYELAIFDRSLEIGRLIGANKDYIEREIPHLDRLLARSPEEALDGARTVVIGHVGADDLPVLEAGLAGKTVVDLAGIDRLRRAPGVDYHGICW